MRNSTNDFGVIPEVAPSVKDVVQQALGLETLRPGIHYKLDGQMVIIDAIWMTQVIGEFPANVYLIGVDQIDYVPMVDEEQTAWKFISSYKHMLLATDIQSDEVIKTSTNTFMETPLSNEIASQLHSLDIMPFMGSYPELDGTRIEFSLHVYSQGGVFRGRYSGNNLGERLGKFYSATLTEIENLARSYNDSTMLRIVFNKQST